MSRERPVIAVSPALPAALCPRSLRWVIGLAALALLVLLLCPTDAFAGPGGEIVEWVFKSKVGRIVGGIILGILFIVLLPLVIYVWLRERAGIRRTTRDLEALARRFPAFAWPAIERRIREVVPKLYAAWNEADLSPVQDLFTAEYYSSQQDILDRWSEEGKRNVTKLEKIEKIAPLHVNVETEQAYSTLYVLVRVSLLDYLEEVSTRKLIKGKRKVKEDHDTIWVLLLHGDEWLLHAVESGDMSLAMATEKNTVDTSYLDRMAAVRRSAAPRRRAASELAPVDPAADVPAAETEEPVVDVESRDDDGGGPGEVDEGRK